MQDSRYIQNKDKFLEYSYIALRDNFSSREDFDSFFNSIESDEEKNLFLRSASFYLFIVKKGVWKLNITDVQQSIDYLTNTFKYIALFSLVESLYSKEEHIDFYKYMMQHKNNINFPFHKKPTSVLTEAYEKYKSEFGSQRMALRFFESLDIEDKELIKQRFTVRGSESPFKKLVNILYKIRSKFVHQADLVVGFGRGASFGTVDKEKVLNKLSIEDLQNLFEHGLIKRFQKESI